MSVFCTFLLDPILLHLIFKKTSMIKLVKQPVLFSFSLQDLVRLASRKVPEANIIMFQDMPRQKKSTRKGSSKLWT